MGIHSLTEQTVLTTSSWNSISKMKQRGLVDRLFFGPLATRNKQRAFTEFLDQKHCGEIAHFLSAVAELRHNPNVKHAQELYVRFIDDSNNTGSLTDAETDTLNLSAQTREAIRRRLSERPGSAEAFAEAVDECARLVVQNGFAAEWESLEQLVQSQQNTKYAVALAWALVVITAAIVTYVVIFK